MTSAAPAHSRRAPSRSTGAFSPVGCIARRAIHRAMACCSPVRGTAVGIMGRVEILLWWVPPAIVTLVAMLWVSWLGRARDVGPDRSDAAQERFAAAIMRDLPSEVANRVSAPRPIRERSTGIAIRPSQLPPAPGTPSSGGPEGTGDSSRRSA